MSVALSSDDCADLQWNDVGVLLVEIIREDCERPIVEQFGSDKDAFNRSRIATVDGCRRNFHS